MMKGGFTELLLDPCWRCCSVAAVIDVRTFTISNGLNLAVALLAPLYWWSIGPALWPGRGDPGRGRAGGVPLLAWPSTSGMMGGGDVKLAAALWPCGSRRDNLCF